MSLIARVAAVYLGGGPKVSLTGSAIDSNVTDPADASSQLRFETDGTFSSSIATPSSFSKLGDWILPNAAANSGYEVGYTALTGDAFTAEAAAADAWVAISAARLFALSRTTVGTSAITSVTFRIRDATTQAILASAVFTFEAVVEA